MGFSEMFAFISFLADAGWIIRMKQKCPVHRIYMALMQPCGNRFCVKRYCIGDDRVFDFYIEKTRWMHGSKNREACGLLFLC